MCSSFYKRGSFAWVQDVRANFVCVLQQELAAMVFSTSWGPWQVILYYPASGHDPERTYMTYILRHEGFDDPQAAMSRAEAILTGTAGHRTLQLLRPGDLDLFTRSSQRWG